MRKFGNSGFFVSELSFGAMTFGGADGPWGKVGRLGQEDADALVKAALDAGINLFDTANIYANGRSEEILGRSLKNIGVARDDVVIATKVLGAMGEGPNRQGASRRHIVAECRASLFFDEEFVCAVRKGHRPVPGCGRTSRTDHSFFTTFPSRYRIMPAW